MTASPYFSPKGIHTTWDYVDFDGPCAQCYTHCVDEWSRMWDRKFGTGFVVDGLETDPAGGFNEQIIFGKKWPQYSVKANTFDSESNKFVTIPVAAKIEVGDIRVAYTDHWVTQNSYSQENEDVRTFMKRPEEYWAAKYNPYPQQGGMTEDEFIDAKAKKDEQRDDWIRCKHSHTDHTHEATLSGGGTSSSSSYPIAIDDCVTGIWDFNLVDTCTTIETYDIYEAVHLYEVFPACGNLTKMSPPDETISPLFHIWADQTKHKVHAHGTRVCEVCHDTYDPGNWLHFMKHRKCHPQPCGCGSLRGQEGKGIVFATSPWCDHTLARESKNPHRLGMQLQQHGYRAQLFDNEGEDKIFGAVSETFLQKVGSFYKTTVRRQPYGVHQSFQAPSSAATVMYTFLDPKKPGDGPAGHENQGTAGGYWCTRETDDEDDPDKWDTKMGASYLLTLPCNYPLNCSENYFEDGATDRDGPQCCEDWDYEYCEEQLEHIYFTEADILAAFDRDPRLKSSDLEKNNSRERIHPDGGPTKPLSCQTTVVNGYVWLAQPCEASGDEKPTDYWERGLPISPEANCVPTGGTCDCGKFPGPPPSTLLQANWNRPTVQTSFASFDSDLIISTLWGVDGIHLGSACSWGQSKPGKFVHCGSDKKGGYESGKDEADGFLVGVGFYQGSLNEEGQIGFSVVRHLKLHLPKIKLETTDTPWAQGSPTIGGWTDYDMRKPELANDKFDQEGSRFVTDFEAAEVFIKAGSGTTKYWYDIVAKRGEQLNYMGELEGTAANIGYLSTGVMNEQFQDPKRCVGDPPKSRCGSPSLVGASSTANEFGPWCSLNDPVDGCDDMPTRIFTGVGDPAPRFDEDQRVTSIEVLVEGSDDETKTECIQYVDEYFMLSDKLVKCIKDGGGYMPEIDNCTRLHYGYKKYIKLKDEVKETGFFTCGLPVGNVDRDFPLTDQTGPVVGLEGDPLWDFCYCEDDCGAIIDIYPVIDVITMQRDFSYTNEILCKMPKDIPDNNGVYGYGGEWKCDNFGAPELDLCGTTWHDLEEYGREDSPNRYCGLVPDAGSAGTGGDSDGSDGEGSLANVVSCTACEDFVCQEGLPFDASVDQLPEYVSCAGGVGGDEGNGVHCCSFLVPNPFYNPLVDSLNTPVGHPRIVTSSCLETQEYCEAYGYLGGMPHVPYEKGYIWHSVLGWHPDMAIERGITDYRYQCTAGKVNFEGNEHNMAFDCCSSLDKDLGDEGVASSCNGCTQDPQFFGATNCVPKNYEYPKVTVEDAPTPIVYLL